LIYANSSRKLIISATTVGSILEWCEFSLYTFLGPTIAKLFFPPTDSNITSTMNILLIFGIGFISRPIGGLFFGYIGDRYGRRIALLSSIIMITFPTFMMGFLPIYAEIGYWAPVLLVALRLLQGFPVGGQFPGTMCYLAESVSPKERGFIGSFAFFGTQLGIMINILECLYIDRYVSTQQFLDWGWRVSFITSGFIGLLGFALGYILKETPLFLSLEKQEHVNKAPIVDVIKKFKT